VDFRNLRPERFTGANSKVHQHLLG
jgi:hypothetical protein